MTTGYVLPLTRPLNRNITKSPTEQKHSIMMYLERATKSKMYIAKCTHFKNVILQHW